MTETTDKIWVLREASTPFGFMPNELNVSEFAKSLECSGWLRETERHQIRSWKITEKGRAELARLEAQNALK
jgi:hypothetical protein